MVYTHMGRRLHVRTSKKIFSFFHESGQTCGQMYVTEKKKRLWLFLNKSKAGENQKWLKTILDHIYSEKHYSEKLLSFCQDA